MRIGRRVPSRRSLHPAAWWAWAAGMAAAAAQTTNPILLALLGAVIAFVVAARRSSAPYGRSMAVFLRLGIAVIVVRVVLQVVFGDRTPGHVLFSLPEVPLPSWAAGVSIGGPVTAESVLAAATQGLRLAVILLAFGAANSLASPYRLLRCLPAVLYEAGMAVTVALTFAPELVVTVRNLQAARRLRGRPVRGIAGLRGMAIPLLTGALDRSLELAASMDARGYGRREAVPRTTLRLGVVATGGGLLLVLGGVYGTLGTSTTSPLGLGALVAGGALLLAGLAAGGRRNRRSRYRPDRWLAPEWGVLAAGCAAATGYALAAALTVPGLQVDWSPLAWPTLPLLPAAASLVGVLPALVAPNPPAAGAARTADADQVGTGDAPALSPVGGQVP